MKITKPFPLSFMQDFKPERRLLAQLLAFAYKNGVGDKEEISASTGIPTGANTGKVEPIIYYASAMGLIAAEKEQGKWSLSLTSLGKLVFAEDPYLSEELTLWLMHLMLCRPCVQIDTSAAPTGIVDPWFTLFSLADARLGGTFTSLEYMGFMAERFGSAGNRKTMSTVILNSYKDESCLGLIHALEFHETENRISKNQAPKDSDFYPVYSAYFFLLWDEFFINERQIVWNDFVQCSRILTVMQWNQQEATTWLYWMVDQGMLQLDQQTGSYLVLRTMNTIEVINNVYSNLL